MRGRDLFKRFKWAILLLKKYYSIYPLQYRKYMYEKSMIKRGKIAIAKRYALLGTMVKSIGDNVMIGTNVYIYNPENIEIGKNVSIHPLSYIDGYGGLYIGDDVSIATGTTIMTFNHTYVDRNEPIKDQPLIKKKVCIEDDVWIGARCVILGGTTIHRGSVIGAGAVVTKNIDENSIAMGVPANVRKER